MNTNQKLADRFDDYSTAAEFGFVPFPDVQKYWFIRTNQDKYNRISIEVFQDEKEILEHVDDGREILAMIYESSEEMHVIFQD